MSRFSVDRGGFVSVDVHCPCMKGIHFVKGILWCIVGRLLGS